MTAVSDMDKSGSAARSVLLVVGPIALLVLLAAFVVILDPLAGLRAGAPPVEDLTVDRVVLSASPSELLVTVVNGGPESVTIAQVIVDDAYWMYAIEPGPTLESLRSAGIRIPYPWVEGEPLVVTIVTSTGLTFDHEIEAAVATPALSPATLVNLGLLGACIGLLPVLIGIAWRPWITRLSRRALNGLLALTVGVLTFIAVETVTEGLELAPLVPTAVDGRALLFSSALVALSMLMFVADVMRGRFGVDSARTAAALVAIGIGLHNFGEGLTMAAAYAAGLVALTTLLLVGFAVHNVTEGLAIVAPLAQTRVTVGALVALGVVAGAPTIVGAWTGVMAWSPTLAVVFFGLGAGAVVQVIWEIVGLIRHRGELSDRLVAGGFALGVLVMYGTAIFVAA